MSDNTSLIDDLMLYFNDKFKDELIRQGHRKDVIEACMSNEIKKPVVK